MADDFVTVSKDAQDALPTPIFIIKRDDVFYVTLAVWEYDMSQATTDEQRQGVSAVAALFEQGMPKLQAVEATDRSVSINEATNPPPN